MSNNLTSWKSTLKEAHTKFVAINPEKAQTELGFAMQIFQNSETLQRCEPQSILNAVVNVARTSVTLNPVMRLAYLVPRKNKCVLDFSYMGLVAMLRDNNCIKSISAHIVYQDEEFDYDVAYNKITHKPNFAKTEEEHKLRNRIGCYSRATLPNGEVVFEFMPMWEIEKVKRLSEGSSNKFSAWQTWEEEMIKKVVIKRHFKMLISGNPSEALSTALQIENENNALINSFDQKPANGAKKRPSLMSAFEEEEEEPTNQLSILDEEEPKSEVKSKPQKNKGGAMNMDYTEEEIEALLDQEMKKVQENPAMETKDISSLDLFADEDPNQYAQDTYINNDEEPEEDMGWFPTPKDK
jgi:phage RecT family recombinase